MREKDMLYSCHNLSAMGKIIIVNIMSIRVNKQYLLESIEGYFPLKENNTIKHYNNFVKLSYYRVLLKW